MKRKRPPTPILAFTFSLIAAGVVTKRVAARGSLLKLAASITLGVTGFATSTIIALSATGLTALFSKEITTFENRGSHTFEKEENIIEDTAEVMAGLIDQNKKQKDIIAEQERQIDSLLDFKRKAFEENKTLVETNEALKKKLRLLEKESLSNDERVTELEEELNELRMQVSGKDDLARLVADAKNLLGETE